MDSATAFLTETSAPRVENPANWNSWGQVDFSVGFVLAIYMSISGKAYGHTCYNSVLSHAYGSISNAKYFAKGLKLPTTNLKWALFIFHWFERLLSLVKMVTVCTHEYAGQKDAYFASQEKVESGTDSLFVQ